MVRLPRRVLVLLAALFIVGAACNSVDEALGGGRQPFSRASNSFSAAGSAYVDEVNALFESGDKETYISDSAPTVATMSAGLAKMRRAAKDVTGSGRGSADRAVQAAEAMTNEAATIGDAVRANDVESAQRAANQFDVARGTFNTALNGFTKAG